MIDRIASSHASHGRATGYAHSHRVDVAGADIFDLRKVDAVFVAERQIAQKVCERVDASLGEEFCALGADSFEHAHVGLQTFRHRSVYIIGAEKGRIDTDAWYAGYLHFLAGV